MSVEDFYMKIGRSMFGETKIEIIAAEGSMKSELEVSLPDFEDGLTDVRDYLFDWIKKTIEPAARIAEDDGLITAGELNAFLKVLETIEW